jgi:hypothetical protein
MAVATDFAAATRDDVIPAAPGPRRKTALGHRTMAYLPRGNMLSDEVWRRRHNILQWLLLLHLPALIAFGFYMRHTPSMIFITVAPIAVFRVLGGLPTGRRLASFFTTAGIVYCSAALVVLADGATEAHFHFFIIVGFIALYQDWVPFGWDIAFTVLSHGLGSWFRPNMMFDHMAAMKNPWEWSIIHGVSVLAACVGVVLFWRTNEDEQHKALALTQELGDAEINRRRFASDLLVNLARRNQSLLYRQLDIISQLEHSERDPDALAGLFRLDHLATRIRRNAENLLVLSGEEPPRVWGKPVPLSDVVRAAIAETEDLSRVTFVVDERLSVVGQAVIDLTHLLAELIENAVRSSPPESQVTIRTTPDVRSPGTVMLTVEDWGVGMPDDQLREANLVLAEPRDVDALVSNRLGLHVISRLAARYSLQVVLTATSGSGITAVVLLPPTMFTSGDRPRSGSPSGPMAMTGAPTPTPTNGGAMPVPQRSPRLFEGPTGSDQSPFSSSVNGTANGAMNGTPNGFRNGPPNGSMNGSVQDSALPTRPSGRPPRPAPMPAPPSVVRNAPEERTGQHWSAWWDPEAEAAAAQDRTAVQNRPAGPDRVVEPDRAAEPDWAAAQDQPEADGRWLPVAPPITVETELEVDISSLPRHPDTAGSSPGVTVTVSDPMPAATSPGFKLHRRTPQAHLAPELHRDRQAAEQRQATAAAAAGPPVDAARAREALSRYQASRRAALADNDTEERN